MMSAFRDRVRRLPSLCGLDSIQKIARLLGVLRPYSAQAPGSRKESGGEGGIVRPKGRIPRSARDRCAMRRIVQPVSSSCRVVEPDMFMTVGSNPTLRT